MCSSVCISCKLLIGSRGLTRFRFVFVLVFFSWPCHYKFCGVLVPRPGMEPRPPAEEVHSLNHWMTWEIFVLIWLGFLFVFFFFFLLYRKYCGFSLGTHMSGYLLFSDFSSPCGSVFPCQSFCRVKRINL